MAITAAAVALDEVGELARFVSNLSTDIYGLDLASAFELVERPAGDPEPVGGLVGSDASRGRAVKLRELLAEAGHLVA